jgi:hypothetical protein
MDRGHVGGPDAAAAPTGHLDRLDLEAREVPQSQCREVREHAVCIEDRRPTASFDGVGGALDDEAALAHRLQRAVGHTSSDGVAVEPQFAKLRTGDHAVLDGGEGAVREVVEHRPSQPPGTDTR